MPGLAADRGYLRQIVGKKLSAKQAEKYGVDVNDPDGLRKRKEELDALAERWRNPSLHDDLMEEIRAAFKQEYAGESWLDMQRVDNAPLMVQSRELGRADFSTSGEKKEEKKYRVVGDTAGLAKHLDKKVEYVEIKYTGDLAKDKADYEKKLGRSLSDIAYYREAIVDALMEIAARNPEPLPIGETGYNLELPKSRTKAKKAQGRARTPKKMQAVQGLEDVVRKAIHLDSETP